MSSRYNIKVRLLQINWTQVDLIKALREKNENVSPPHLSSFIRGAIVSPRSEKILTMCDEILSLEEKKVN